MEALKSSEHISPEGLKRFVKHLCIVSKKHSDRELARAGLGRQIKKVKTVSLAKKPKRWLIEKELKSLNNKISIVLEKESKLLGIEQKDSALIFELKNRIQQLERELFEKERASEEKIEEVGSTLSELREKIGQIHSTKVERTRRIKELEEKIKAKPRSTTHDVLVLKEQIKALEAKYNKMKKKYSKEDLIRIETRIDLLKEKLASQL